MMNLQIQTKNETRKGDVINAYNEALKECNLNDFITSLDNNIGSSLIGRGGRHIWIKDSITNEQLAIIIL